MSKSMKIGTEQEEFLLCYRLTHRHYGMQRVDR